VEQSESLSTIGVSKLSRSLAEARCRSWFEPPTWHHTS
jgi:hypothetical protein